MAFSGKIAASAKPIAKWAFTLIAFYAALCSVFHFSRSQSLGLALALSIAIDVAISRKSSELARFTPHRLSVQFHAYPALLDLGLIVSDEQWKEFLERSPDTESWGPNSALYRFVVAYVIGANPPLIHYPSLRLYTERWLVEHKLEAIQLMNAVANRTWAPELYVKPGLGGHHIGVRVNQEWWEQQRGDVKSGIVLNEDREYQFGTMRLCLAILPFDTSAAYYGDVGRNHQSELKERVSKSGWKNEPLGHPEIGYFGEGYEHRYATVWAQHLPE